jgi:hypothetical protein
MPDFATGESLGRKCDFHAQRMNFRYEVFSFLLEQTCPMGKLM